MTEGAGSPERVVYSISGLNEQIKELLEHSFPLLWVEGEISNFSAPASGHWYLSLKDEQAQVRCAMFRGRNQLAGFQPKNGMQVLARVRVSLYAPRGEYQLIVEHLEESGEGALRRAFDLLKKKLQAEGLFDEALKKPLPASPCRIGVITSPTGAAIRDILHVLRRRYPLCEVLIYPVPVQGKEAAPAIVRALQLACERADCDVLILARGGGSLEDLWAFNEEIVARAIHACPIPVISGVGHEIDFTIADFIADLRAPTPSAAAELVSRNVAEWQQWLARVNATLAQAQFRRLTQFGHRQDFLFRRLSQLHPRRRLEQTMQRLDEMEQRLTRATRTHIEKKTHALALMSGVLDRLSPLKTLERGYAIASRSDGRVLTDAAAVTVGDRLGLRLHSGAVECEVLTVRDGAK